MANSQSSTLPESPQIFADRLKLPFTNYFLLNRALTHRSYLNENADAIEDNERLEFLGDAVLDFVVAAWLYNHFPEMAEGEMTRLRASLVKTETLAIFGRTIGIGDAILLGRGELENGGRDRTSLLCDTFEAVMGALYLDAGIDAVISFISPFLIEAADDFLTNNHSKDAKSMLQEWAQSQGFSTPDYVICNEEGPDHNKTFSIDVFIGGQKYGQGVGKSKQGASKSAAIEALKNLGIWN